MTHKLIEENPDIPVTTFIEKEIERLRKFGVYVKLNKERFPDMMYGDWLEHYTMCDDADLK